MPATAKTEKARAVPPAPSFSDPGAPIFVWLTWAVMLIAAVAFIIRFGMNIPFWDDFELIPPLVDSKQVTLSWLWSSHNGHRILLPRLILLAAYHLTNNDFRVGMFFTIAVLAGAAASLIVAARSFRGGTSYTDAFFPLILLSPGQHANFLWSYMVSFALGSALTLGLMLTQLRTASVPQAEHRLKSTVLFGVLLLSLALCGANGIAFVPALSAWSLYIAAQDFRSSRPGSRRLALVRVLLTAPALIALFLYFGGGQGASDASRGGPEEIARTSLQFLSLGAGSAVAQIWPYSGVFTLGLFMMTLLLLVVSWIRSPSQRPQILAILATLAGMVSLTLGMGWGRSGEGERAGLQDRYVTIAIPTLIAIYFAWNLLGSPRSQRLVSVLLFTFACLFLWPNTQLGLEHGQRNLEASLAFDRDISNSVPIYQLAKRYSPFLHPSQDSLAEGLLTLKKAGIGRFQYLRADPTFHEIPLDPKPAILRQATWSDGTAHIQGVDPYLVYELPKARYISGIRLRYAHSNPRNSDAHFRLSWRHDQQRETPPSQTASNWALPTGEEGVTTVWITDTIKQILIQPDNQPCDFRIKEIVLLVE